MNEVKVDDEKLNVKVLLSRGHALFLKKKIKCIDKDLSSLFQQM